MSRNAESTLSGKVVKAIGILTGVQGLTVLCSVVRTKLVAILLGADGVGLFAIYNSTIDMLASATQLNLRQSAVRDISAAPPARVAAIVAVVRRWALWLGVAGMVGVAAASPLLSRWAFGNAGHTAAFAVLATVMLMSSLQSAELAVLQGRHELRRLAKATAWGVATAVVLSVPLFFWLRLDSIVPVILVSWLTGAVAARAMRDPAEPRCAARPAAAMVWTDGQGFVRLGFYFTVASFVTLLGANMFLIYMNRTASAGTVGIYQAGYTLVNTYVGVIFTAMALEYYPRLSAIASQKVRAGVIVSHEITVVLWLLMPVVVSFVALDQVIVRLLYASSFMAVLPYVTVAVCGVTLRAMSWCMAYVILARGDGSTYIATESLSAAVTLALNVAGYRLGGLMGLGVSYVAVYAIYTLVTWAIFRYCYGMRLSGGVWRLAVLAITVSATAVALKMWAGWWAALLLLVPLVPAAYRRVMHRRQPSCFFSRPARNRRMTRTKSSGRRTL